MAAITVHAADGMTWAQIREVCTGAGLAAGHALLTLRGMCPQPSPGGAAGGSYAPYGPSQ
eukprot:gene19390-49812_t